MSLCVYRLRDWQLSNIQHWQMAHYHGKVVGMNMLAQNDDLKVVKSVPFFWTQQFGKSLRYTGKKIIKNMMLLTYISKIALENELTQE